MRKTFDDIFKEIMGENIMTPTTNSNKQPTQQQDGTQQPGQTTPSTPQQPPATTNNQQGDEEELFKLIQAKMGDSSFNNEKFMELFSSLQQQNQQQA
jgi:heme-binding NEAT domain protein